MKSMTAFGRAVKNAENKNITVEMKSVNSRFLDLSIHLPRAYSFLEDRVRAFVCERVKRGKVDVGISVETISSTDTVLKLDEGYAKQYVAALYELRDKYKLRDDVSVMKVAENRDLFITSAEDDSDTIFDELLPVLKEALDQFETVALNEGKNLCEDLKRKRLFILENVEKIAEKSEQCISGYRDKLEARIRKILDDHDMQVDENRLLTECAIYADRVSIDEELVRLRSHIDAMLRFLEADGQNGKNLDYLVQEMNREVNTIGSKCMDAEIAQIVVSLKNEIEKIREQVQNLE